MKITAFVHAKGNSERLPNKNLKLLNGKPLFTYAIENAKKASRVTEVVIDSDSDDILSIGAELGATPLKRSVDLASNMTTGDDLAYWQASQFSESELVLQVVPTAPFIQAESIDMALSKLLHEQVDSVVGVCREKFYFWQDGRPVYFNENGTIPNSFELPDTIFETTGLYINRTSFVLEHKKRLNPESCAPYFLRKLEAVDINNAEDFELAEILCRGLYGGNGN